MPISQGNIKNLLDSFSEKSGLAYLSIKENIAKAVVVGADETGVKVDGAKCWIHTWQDPYKTSIAVSGCRGIKAIKNNFPVSFPASIR